MSQNALPTTVMIGASLIVSFLAERICRGNRVRVQLKTVSRIEHHCGFSGISTTTIPGLSPVASLSAMCISPVRFNFESNDAARESEPLIFNPGTL